MKAPMATSTKLFTPGPVAVKDKVRQALSKPILFHRTEPFEKLYKKLNSKLNIFFGGDDNFIPLIITGSGTLANEIVISSLLKQEDKLLVISNGHFGERIASTAKLHGKRLKIIDCGWAKKIKLNKVEKEIRKFKPKMVSLVALETSTGMVNPVRQVGQICKKYNTTFFVDGVSAIGGEDISVLESNIDVCSSVSNKALEAVPGLSFICIKKDVLEKQARQNPVSYYLDLSRYYLYHKKHQSPTTPAISVMQGVDVALDQFISETLQNRIKRYQKLSGIVDDSASSLGLKQLISKENRANAISTFYLPKASTARNLRDFLLTNGYTVWSHDYGKTDERLRAIMQVSVMGDIDAKDIESLFSKIRFFIQENPLKY